MRLRVAGWCMVLTLLGLGIGLWSQPRDFEQRTDVVYGEVEGQKLLLDLYLPKDKGKDLRPAVVAVHGGAWHGGNKRDMRPFAESLVRRGCVVASVSYRLAPKWTYPAQLDDVQRAVRWLRRHAAELGIHPRHIGAIGVSAGGHLVSLLGTRETRDDSDPELKGLSSKVQAVVNIFGPSDLSLPQYLEALPAGSPKGWVEQVLKGFLGKPYEEAPDLWRDASPLFHVSSDDAAFFILQGSEDPLVPKSQAERLAEALKKAGVEVHLVIVENMGHDLGRTPEAQKRARQALEEAMEFLDRHLKQP